MLVFGGIERLTTPYPQEKEKKRLLVKAWSAREKRIPKLQFPCYPHSSRLAVNTYIECYTHINLDIDRATCALKPNLSMAFKPEDK